MIICHLTTVHKPLDVRIFQKECRSLATAGYQVHLVVPSDKTGTHFVEGVTIHYVSMPKNRTERFTKTGKLVFEAGLATGAKIFHLHDPELLLLVNKIKRLNKSIIYDSHEDLPRQITGKPWISKPLRHIIAATSEKVEDYYASKVDAVVTATPHIAERFIKVNATVRNINNYPVLEEYPANVLPKPFHERGYVAYIGGITRIRGIVELIQAISLTNKRLILAGEFENEALLKECQSLPGWDKVEFRGLVSRKDSVEILAGALAGIVTFHALPNHINAIPNKMFEYAAASTPVIASDFEAWKNILHESNFGLTVNPTSPVEIASAINLLAETPVLAERLGKNGREAVLSVFNWKPEESKLIRLYKEIENKTFTR